MNKILPKQRNGFTLVEVAVVLFFMGIFVSFASTMLKNIALSTKLRDARERLTVASDAVQTWAVSKREIPSNLSLFTSAVGNNSVDYWNKPFAFHSYTTQPGAVRDICRRSSTNLAVCPGGDCSSKIIKDIAYVIISGGDGLTINNPTRFTASPCSVTQPCIPIKDLSTTNDDLYKYVTLLELKKTVGCTESDSGLRIITNDLPFANVSSNIFNTNSFNVEAAGGFPYVSNKYRWSRTGNLPDGLSFSPTFVTYTTTQKLRIIGSPINSGTFNVTVTASDNSTVPVSTSKPFVLTIKPK